MVPRLPARRGRRRAQPRRGSHRQLQVAFRFVPLFDEQPALAEDEANDRTFRTRRLRLLLDVDAAALRQVHGHARALELHHEEFPAAADGYQLLPVERVVHRNDGLQRRELQRHDPLDARAPKCVAEALGQRLHLRELGHVVMLPVSVASGLF